MRDITIHGDWADGDTRGSDTAHSGRVTHPSSYVPPSLGIFEMGYKTKKGYSGVGVQEDRYVPVIISDQQIAILVVFIILLLLLLTVSPLNFSPKISCISHHTTIA